MNISKVEDAVKLIEKSGVAFTEADKQRIAWYAFKTEDDELTQKLVEELAEADCDRGEIFRKYYAIADHEAPWIEQIERLLVSIEIIRIQEKEALKLLTIMIENYAREQAEKDKRNLENVYIRETSARMI